MILVRDGSSTIAAVNTALHPRKASSGFGGFGFDAIMAKDAISLLLKYHSIFMKSFSKFEEKDPPNDPLNIPCVH